MLTSPHANALPGLHAAFATAKALGTANLKEVPDAKELLCNSPPVASQMELTKEANTAATAEVTA